MRKDVSRYAGIALTTGLLAHRVSVHNVLYAGIAKHLLQLKCNRTEQVDQRTRLVAKAQASVGDDFASERPLDRFEYVHERSQHRVVSQPKASVGAPDTHQNSMASQFLEDLCDCISRRISILQQIHDPAVTVSRQRR
jgi:hypothetical protein